MAFFNKLGDIARNIGDKATDAIESNKLNNKINAEKSAIAECMRKIGEYYYGKHQEGEPVDEGVAELMATIDEHNQVIEDAQAEYARKQAESAAQAMLAAQAEEAAPAVVSKDVTCPGCGKSNPEGTKFCYECGAKLEAPVAADERTCPGCGVLVPVTSKFCGECGYRFE